MWNLTGAPCNWINQITLLAGDCNWLLELPNFFYLNHPLAMNNHRLLAIYQESFVCEVSCKRVCFYILNGWSDLWTCFISIYSGIMRIINCCNRRSIGNNAGSTAAIQMLMNQPIGPWLVVLGVRSVHEKHFFLTSKRTLLKISRFLVNDFPVFTLECVKFYQFLSRQARNLARRTQFRRGHWMD